MGATPIETQGTTIGIGNGDSPLTYTNIGGIKAFNGLDGQAAEIDTTDLDSTAKTFLMGLQDFGNLSMDIFFDLADAGQDLIRAAKASRELQNFKITFSDANTATFNGYVTAAPISGGVDAAMEGSINLRISGDVTFT